MGRDRLVVGSWSSLNGILKIRLSQFGHLGTAGTRAQGESVTQVLTIGFGGPTSGFIHSTYTLGPYHGASKRTCLAGSFQEL